VDQLRRFREHGVHVLGSFIFGLPSDRVETFDATAVGDPNRLGAHGLDELDHGGAEYRVAVEDEDSRRRVVGKRLT
jgi:hypothetical protein